MRVMVFVAVAGAFLVCGGVVFAVVRLLGKGPVELVFVLGAIVGAQVGAALHHRAAGARDSMGVKVRVGATLAVCALVLGVVLQAGFGAFAYAPVSIPFAVVGSFVLGLLMFGPMWNALEGKGRR